jgi:dinuclear metal center YbgI/SA1388 family protein
MIVPKISDIVGIINKIAPFADAETWDNVGLQVGSPAAPAGRIMVALDPCREAIEEAIANRCQLLLTHHPLIFTPLKKISLAEPGGNLIALLIKNDIAVVSLHTNYDAAKGGVNDLLAERLGLDSVEPLRQGGGETLVKLVIFVPEGHEAAILEALSPYSGFIGNYSDCSFRVAGKGTFRPKEGATPFVGEIGRREEVCENRVEVLLRQADLAIAINALRKVHPYEEPAFDIYPLLNKGEPSGLGRIGRLAGDCTLETFAAMVRDNLKIQGIRYVGEAGRKVRKVALCGGSGASLLREAIFRGADVLVTGDVKYHEAREAEAAGLALIDAGHFGTELPMVAGLAAQLNKEFGKRGFQAEILCCSCEKEPFRYLME